MTTLGDELQRLRTNRDLTQAQLGRLAGISRICICLLERGIVKHPRYGTLISLTDAMDVPLDILLEASGLRTPGRGQTRVRDA